MPVPEMMTPVLAWKWHEHCPEVQPHPATVSHFRLGSAVVVDAVAVLPPQYTTPKCRREGYARDHAVNSATFSLA